ncbi:MAG TPA: RNB domain-containing ribonuclease [Casimicrobiaceae bacterium]|nr:RNB domain-containing ribonuclease [Casimicrobiaceae bacterium]
MPSTTTDLHAIAWRAMKSRGLEPDFPAAAQREAAQIGAPATAGGAATRDLRELLWASIDNDDSRDLDQLSVAAPAAGGASVVRIAIADVDALIAAHSAIDGHASLNTTSVYTAGGVFPMLPLKFSTDLTSLNPDVDRLAIVVEMTVGADGEIGASDIYRAQVRNRAKLAYDSVAAWLDGKAAAPPPVAAVAGMDAQLRLQDRIAQDLKRARTSRGALELETSEARAVFDNGTLADLLADEPNRAKVLIEDYMIGANGVVARFLAGKGFATLRRVLPVPQRWDRIVALATGLGDALPAAPDAKALNAFLLRRRAADPARYADLSLSVIKLLGRGEYVADCCGEAVEGHFGLAVRDYTHSTAPNRRFPDLVTQRILKAALAGARAPYAEAELTTLAAHCTAQEDNANKVERQVQKSAAAMLLASRIGETFDGIVTGASDKGTWVRIARPMAEGRVVRGDAHLDVGDAVRVKLVGADVERGFIDFARADARA